MHSDTELTCSASADDGDSFDKRRSSHSPKHERVSVQAAMQTAILEHFLGRQHLRQVNRHGVWREESGSEMVNVI